MGLRVIAGLAGGVPLFCPSSGHVRPTMDQVRGAIFSSLADLVPGARVLDLFAGAGTLGIEALSRGAEKAVLVERDRRTMDFVRRNLEKTHLTQHAESVCLDVFTYLGRTVSAKPFDLIFADPPYTTKDQPEDFAARLLSSPHLPSWLVPGGVFILEKSPRHALSEPLSGWEIFRQKRYGTTEVLFLRWNPDGERNGTGAAAQDADGVPSSVILPGNGFVPS